MNEPAGSLLDQSVFDELVRHSVQRTRRYGGDLWMLYWAIDGHAAMKRALGPEQAEAITLAAAERAQGCTRRSDILARLDTNLFALLLLEANEYVATVVGDRIRRNMHRHRADAGESLNLTISCGATILSERERLTTWQRRARRALNAAQKAGGDQVLILHPRRRRESPADT